MYKLKISKNFLDERYKVNSLAKHKDRIDGDIVQISQDPLSVGKPLKYLQLGQYYKNCGRYCVLYDVDNHEKIVSILSLVSDHLLDRILKSKLD